MALILQEDSDNSDDLNFESPYKKKLNQTKCDIDQINKVFDAAEKLQLNININGIKWIEEFLP